MPEINLQPEHSNISVNVVDIVNAGHNTNIDTTQGAIPDTNMNVVHSSTAPTRDPLLSIIQPPQMTTIAVNPPELKPPIPVQVAYNAFSKQPLDNGNEVQYQDGEFIQLSDEFKAKLGVNSGDNQFHATIITNNSSGPKTVIVDLLLPKIIKNIFANGTFTIRKGNNDIIISKDFLQTNTYQTAIESVVSSTILL